MKVNIGDLVAEMLAGSQSSLARLITLVESDSPDVPEVMERIHAHLGKSYCIGITGAAGVGKSTLVNALVTIARGKGLSVGILAADPSSALHGGAVLGDRIRMQQHSLDNQVFIRSMATRGGHGGLPKCTGNTTKLLDAFGKDIVIVETIGVGQTEIAITEVADTVVLVLSPDSGDSIQFMKAGLMEVADVIVVNKADHGNAEHLVAELRASLSLSPDSARRETCVLTTQAIDNVGVEELFQELENRRRAARTDRKPRG